MKSERKKGGEKGKQVSAFYCTEIMNHILFLLINDWKNKMILHEKIKPSFSALLVLSSFTSFVYQQHTF
jgi:hypothetical protein